MRYIQNPAIHAKKIKDTWYLLGKDKSVLHELNEVASIIWESLVEYQTVNDLTKTICKKYEVSERVARKDIESFLDKYDRDKYILKIKN